MKWGEIEGLLWREERFSADAALIGTSPLSVCDVTFTHYRLSKRADTSAGYRRSITTPPKIADKLCTVGGEY